ncbi:hypothetical protein PG623_04865 [Riemerella anatipestifer]|nr:hypothetical protein [Riemerella anatipestifer]
MLTKFYTLQNGWEFKAIDVTENIRLTDVNILGNGISSLDISKNANLRFLNISVNRFDKLALRNILNNLPKRNLEDKAKVYIYFRMTGEHNDNLNFIPNEASNIQALNSALAKNWAVKMSYDQGGSYLVWTSNEKFEKSID